MSWYVWKWWRLAWGVSGVRKHVIEGNNRWKKVFKKLYWRYDATKSGTKD